MGDAISDDRAAIVARMAKVLKGAPDKLMTSPLARLYAYEQAGFDWRAMTNNALNSLDKQAVAAEMARRESAKAAT